MKNYKLAPNEVVLHQQPVTLQTEKGDIPVEIVLTDLNFIFVSERKNWLWFKRKSRKVAFAKELVKTYKDAPQIKQTDTSVQICFASEDRVIVFENKKDARTFVIKAWEVVTGKTAFERSIDKLKQAVDCIDDTFDIDVVAILKDVAVSGATQALTHGIEKKAKKWLPWGKNKKAE